MDSSKVKELIGALTTLRTRKPSETVIVGWVGFMMLVIGPFQQLFGLLFKGTMHQVGKDHSHTVLLVKGMASPISSKHNISYAGEVCSRCASPFYRIRGGLKDE